MTSFRHLAYFLTLGLFWGVSPSLYKTWGVVGMPVSHVITLTGFGVAIFLAVLAKLRFGMPSLGRDVQFYGMGCAALMNIPFAISIYLAHYVPPTELALAISTSPIINYLLALLTGRETANGKRLAAIGFGFASTALLVVTRQEAGTLKVSPWLLAAFCLPVCYAFYNWFTSRRAPPAADIYSLGAAESFWSGAIALPFLLFLAPPWLPTQPPLSAYWTVLFACFMWVMERISYFTLIREKGEVYTVQATYVSTPAAVVIASLLYGGGQDQWLWGSLVLLMAALWLNNTGRQELKRQAATPPSS